MFAFCTRIPVIGFRFAAAAMMLAASSAVAWTGPVNLTRVGTDAASATLAIDATGRIHLFVNRSSQTIYHLVVDCQVRTVFQEFTKGVSPSAAGDSSGKIHVVWSEGWEIRYKEWNGSWDTGLATVSDGSGELNNKPHICFGHFQTCLTGPAEPQNEPTCQRAKSDTDNDVDGDDLASFRQCLAGAGMPPSSACPP